MNEVKGDREEIYPDTRMVLQFHQNGHFYRLVFDLFPNEVFPDKPPHSGDIISIFHDGPCPALECDVIPLDGSYDLPTEDIS